MAIEQSQDYLHTGSVEFQSGVKITTGAAANKVLTSDASGNASWQVSGSGAILTATRTLTSAEILSLHTTPIELVSAQGPNTIIIPIKCLFYEEFNTTAYATDILAKVTLDPLFFTTVFNQYALNATADNIVAQISSTISISNVSGLSYLFNAPLVITTASSNPTAGDSDVTVNVLYSVITL